MKPIYLICVAASCLASCASTEYVHISVLEPSPVTLPASASKVAVINRTQASEKAKIIDAVDKTLSLEGKDLDKVGALAGVTGLTDELTRNNRFEHIVQLNGVDLRTETPGRYPAPLDWDKVQQLCNDNNADLLFSLELFDTDTRVSYAANKVNITTPLGSLPALEHQANMETLVKTGWRIYDPVSKTILDEFALSGRVAFAGKGINPVKALEALTGRKEAVKDAANIAGHDYALRLIPVWIRVTRDYFVRGNDNFRIARRKAQTGNWKGAAELWMKEVNNTDRKIAGRANYNMAIINEIDGNLDAAIRFASTAYENYRNKTALLYLNQLHYRKHDQAVLDEQAKN